jgi:hypothetical protein
VDVAAKLAGNGVVDVVTVGCERNRKPCVGGGELAKRHNVGVQRGFATAKTDSQCAIRVKLDEPTRNVAELKFGVDLWRVAMSTC